VCFINTVKTIKDFINVLIPNGDYGTRILDDKQRLMEIKVEGAMPLWLTKALDENNIFPTSFFKYGYCYQNYILKENQTAEQKTTVEYVS